MSTQAARLPGKLAFGLLTTLVLLGLLEGALWAVGTIIHRDWRVDPLPVPRDYRVLCPANGLVKLCPEEHFHYQRVRPEIFFPHPDRPRIVVIGESFVFGYGLPMEQAWPARLEYLLDDRVEVINMGRCGSYSSALVPTLEAALTVEPSLIVLSIGNNEHTMTSFYTGWAGRHPLAFYSISRQLGRLQLFGFLLDALGQDGHVTESQSSAPLVFDNPTDQAVYAARRRPPDLSLFPDALAGPQVTAILEDEQRLKEHIFKGRMESMISQVQDQGIPLLVTTLPADLTRPPTLSGIHDGDPERVRAFHQKLLNPRNDQGSRNDGERQTPEELLAMAMEEDDQVASFHYFHGMMLLGRGQDPAAAQAFRRSMDLDMIPDATPTINGIIRELASATGCALVDLDTLSDTVLRDGDSIFLDGIHVNRHGADVVAAQLAPVVESLLNPAPRVP